MDRMISFGAVWSHVAGQVRSVEERFRWTRQPRTSEASLCFGAPSSRRLRPKARIEGITVSALIRASLLPLHPKSTRREGRRWLCLLGKYERGAVSQSRQTATALTEAAMPRSSVPTGIQRATVNSQGAASGVGTVKPLRRKCPRRVSET
jgi:hypothetical protein